MFESLLLPALRIGPHDARGDFSQVSLPIFNDDNGLGVGQLTCLSRFVPCTSDFMDDFQQLRG
jgi:hypothetical protein